MRRPILTQNIDLIWQAVDTINKKSPFDLIAWVVMPDHFHFLISPGKDNILKIIQRIKLSFSVEYRKRNPASAGVVWQAGFWDHITRNDMDFNHHLDYIHFNPVKHGIVSKAWDYEHSSLNKFKENYPRDWGLKSDEQTDDYFGE